MRAERVGMRGDGDAHMNMHLVCMGDHGESVAYVGVQWPCICTGRVYAAKAWALAYAGTCARASSCVRKDHAFA